MQTLETFHNGRDPAFVEVLDAVAVGRKASMPIAPVMIYGDDVTHVVTEEGVAYLYKAEGTEERRNALAAVAGVSPIGLRAKPEQTATLRPVSYTHLDVYKRQVTCPAATLSLAVRRWWLLSDCR